jgi:hypothetical protein
MQVITKNPIIVDGVYEDYLALDGSSSKEEILTAQKIINRLIAEENKTKPANKLLRPIKEDGIWGPETATAYANRKAKVDAELDRIKQFLGGFLQSGVPNVSTSTVNQISNVQPLESVQKTSWWQKRTKQQKTMIIVTSTLAIGLVAYLLYKKGK